MTKITKKIDNGFIYESLPSLNRLLLMRVLPSLQNNYNGNVWQIASQGYPRHCDRGLEPLASRLRVEWLNHSAAAPLCTLMKSIRI